MVNRHLVEELKALGLWDAKMIEKLKRFDGSVQKIEGIPEELKQRYQTAFELERAGWWKRRSAAEVDRPGSVAQFYMGEANGKKIDRTYRMAWLRWPENYLLLASTGCHDYRKSHSQ